MEPDWRPVDRMALVDLMASRPGADLENFFASHALGLAYLRPGGYSGRKAKINAALLEAEDRGNLADILDEADRVFREGRPAEPNPRAEPTVPTVPTDGRIFISHASQDKALATLLKDTLVTGGVPSERVFYSSERGTGIPLGASVREHLQDRLQACSVVIELITDTFMRRPYCLMEFGAAWVMEKPTFPLVVPPLTREEVVRQIGDVQLDLLGTESDVDAFMDELHDGLRVHANLSVPSTTWGTAVRKFKASFPQIVSGIADNEAQQALGGGGGQPSAREIEAELHGVTVKNTTVKAEGFATEVHGLAGNNTKARKNASLKATFFDNDDRIIGIALGLATEVGPGEAKTFTLTSMNPIEEYSRYTVQIDSVF